MMKGWKFNHSVALAMAVLSFVALWASQSQANIYQGSLSTANGGLVAADGDWAAGLHTLSWTVSNQDMAGLWHYSYTLSVTGHETSHVILEVSNGFTLLENLFDPSWEEDADAEVEVKDNTSQQGNPGLPGTIHGLKVGDTGLVNFDFFSNRVPVWGDFYAKGGNGYLYNAGFGNPDSDPDPGLFPASTDYLATGVFAHVLVPDTVAVPVPGAILLGAVGLGVASSRLRRKST